MIIIGLDLSLAGAGLARYASGGNVTWDVFGTEPHAPKQSPAPDDWWTCERHALILNRIKNWVGLDPMDPRPALVVIEDMFAAQGKSGLDLAQLAGLVRYWVRINRKIPFVLVANSQVKKFTGTPTTKKGIQVSKGINTKLVFQAWGHDTNNDNCADAISLAYIGAAVTGQWQCKNAAQREVVMALVKKNPWLLKMSQAPAA